MGKLLKLLFGLVGGLVLLLVVAAVVIPLAVDPNDFRDEIVQQVKKATGRDLHIGGDMGLSVFPWLGVELADLTLSQPPGFGDAPFAAVRRAQVRARLLPLLDRRLEVDTLRVEGLRLSLVRDAEGLGNWEDLTAAPEAPTPEVTSPDAPLSAPPPARVGLRSLAVGGVQVSEAGIVWDDQQAGRRVSLDDLSLNTGHVVPGEPVDVELALRLDTAQPAVKAGLRLKGRVSADAAGERIRVEPLELWLSDLVTADGIQADLILTTPVDFDAKAQRLEAGPLELRLTDLTTADGLAARSVLKAALSLDLAGETFQIKNLSLEGSAKGGALGETGVASRMVAAVSGDLAAKRYRIQGLALEATAEGADLPGGRLEAQLAAGLEADLAKETLALRDLDLRASDLHLTGQIQGTRILASPAFTGSLALDELNLREWLETLNVSLPPRADAATLGRLRLSTDLSASAEQATFDNLKVVLDDTRLQGSAKLLRTPIPGYRFDLRIDAIDLDRYLPPPAVVPAAGPESAVAAAPAAPTQTSDQPLFPLDALRQLDLDGTLTVGQLVVHRVRLGNATLQVKARDGQLSLDQQVKHFYQGSLGGRLGLDAKGEVPRISVRQQIKAVQAGPLIKDLANQDRLAGTGNLNADVTAAGNTVGAIKRSLNGKLDFAFTDGSVKGFNLGHMLREAVARLKGQALAPEQGPNQTDFSELTGSATLTDGVLSNEDLSAKSPLFRVTGRGTVNLGEDTLDYRIKPVLVASIEGQGGEELDTLKGVPVPVHLKGPIAKPDWSIDIAEALTEAQKERLKEKAREEVDKRLEKALPQELQEKLPGGLKEQLDGAFKSLFR